MHPPTAASIWLNGLPLRLAMFGCQSAHVRVCPTYLPGTPDELYDLLHLYPVPLPVSLSFLDRHHSFHPSLTVCLSSVSLRFLSGHSTAFSHTRS
jgi:hypothetical protein